MKYRIAVRSFIFHVVMGFVTMPMFAHEGHQHEKKEETVKEAVNWRTAEAADSVYEVLLKFEPEHLGAESELLLFVSDYASNSPLDSVEISVYRSNNPSMAFESHREGPGFWHIHAHDLDEGVYDINVVIGSGEHAHMLVIEAVDFRHEKTEVEAHTHSHGWMYGAGAGLLVIGLLAGWYVSKRAGAKKLSMLIGVACAFPLMEGTPALAQHEGHSHGPAEVDAAALTAQFELAKDIQFLLGIRTVIAGESAFDAGRRMYGTVMPSGSGYARIIVPQSGSVAAVYVKPGDRVTRGQELLAIDRNFEVASELTFLAEKNRLRAEYEAAQKEYQRMQSLSDISAKKELEAAKARLQIAEDNLALFESDARRIVIRAPVDGVVGPFATGPGAQVTTGQELFSVTDLKLVYVESQAFEADVDAIAHAGKFMLQCAEEEHTTENVRLLSAGQEYNPSNQSQKVLFEADNPDGDFKLGEFVHIWVYRNDGEVLLSVPNEAIKEIEGRTVVFVKNAAEKFELRYVALGENNGMATVISGGVNDGERVVTEGAYQVKLVYLNQ